MAFSLRVRGWQGLRLRRANDVLSARALKICGTGGTRQWKKYLTAGEFCIKTASFR